MKSRPKDSGLPADSGPKPPSEPQPKVTKKHLTGLEILDEEMNSRLTAQAVPSLPVLPTKSLVPEPVGQVGSTTSLEGFGDFEGYAGGKGKKDDTNADVDSNSGSVTSLTGWSKVGVAGLQGGGGGGGCLGSERKFCHKILGQDQDN